MEIGAVKQAFNNELILMKKKLNQAKTQVINKLTRKAKTLTDKKLPDKLKQKLNKKAESAVKEVLIIKKVKPKDIAKFIITHTEDLKCYLNKPTVDQNKAYARLLLHKSMQKKYTIIRGRFANVPIKDLFMSRQERLKLKKEEREKQMNKNKAKEAKKIDNNSGEWEVEDIDMKNESNDFIDDAKEFVNESDNDSHVEKLDNVSNLGDSGPDLPETEEDENEEESFLSEQLSNYEIDVSDSDEQVTMKPVLKKKSAISNKNSISVEDIQSKRNINKIEDKPKKRHKDVNKNKNFNEKILNRKFKKDAEENLTTENKIVDPFFITSTGEKYMSIAEPRQPDEVKEIHKQGNRKLRRAAMFGHVPKIKPKQYHFEDNGLNNDNYRNKFNNFKNVSHKVDLNNRKGKPIDNKIKFNDKSFNNRNNASDEKSEKLHPSWEAKKRQSGILPFEGKKIVFDES